MLSERIIGLKFVTLYVLGVKNSGAIWLRDRRVPGGRCFHSEDKLQPEILLSRRLSGLERDGRRLFELEPIIVR